MSDKILLDKKDAWLLEKYKWYIDADGYPRTTTKINGKQWKIQWFILKQNQYVVDHKNGNKLDNRRRNLRLCRHWQNMSNSKTPKTNTSGFKGVSKHRNKWAANIKVNNKPFYLGVFNEKEEAYLNYCIAAIYFKKEFANAG